MIKKCIFVFLFLAGAAMLSAFHSRPVQKAVRTLVIDAGHGIRKNGGYDGAHGTYSYEDEICYAISKELVSQIKEKHPEINIIETRPTRYITDLHERANIANRNRGDLFISIHVNAMAPVQHRELTGYKTVVTYQGKGKKKKRIKREVPQYRYYTTPNPAKGTETFIWGSHKNEDKEIAMRENAPMLAEDNYKNNYGDIDPNSAEFIALSLLKTKQYFKRSAMLSAMVEEEFAKVGRISRGQRQRQVGIWVLQATAMPSILVETGYITNKAEEDYLNSKEGQEEVARCVRGAVGNYIAWLEKQQAPAMGTSFLPPPAYDAAPVVQAYEAYERPRIGR